MEGGKKEEEEELGKIIKDEDIVIVCQESRISPSVFWPPLFFARRLIIMILENTLIITVSDVRRERKFIRQLTKNPPCFFAVASFFFCSTNWTIVENFEHFQKRLIARLWKTILAPRK